MTTLSQESTWRKVRDAQLAYHQLAETVGFSLSEYYDTMRDAARDDPDVLAEVNEMIHEHVVESYKANA